MKDRTDITKEHISQAAQTARETGKPVSLGAGTIVVVPKGHYAWTPENQGVLHGATTSDLVKGEAGRRIMSGDTNPILPSLFDPAGARPSQTRTGKPTAIKQADLDKMEIGALDMVSGAIDRTGGKAVLPQEFVNLLGPDRRAAGLQALTAKYQETKDPAQAAQAYLEAAGLHGASYAPPGMFGGGGITGGAPPAPGTPGTPPAPTRGAQIDLGQADASATGPGGVKIYHVAGQWVDAHGQPVGAHAAAPATPAAPPQTAPGTPPAPATPPQAASVETEAGSVLPGLFSSGAPISTPAPQSAQVFTPPASTEAPPSIHQPRKAEAEAYEPSSFDYTDLKQAQRDAGDVTLDPRQRTAANQAVSRLQGVGQQRRPVKAAPLQTTFTDPKDAMATITNPNASTEAKQNASRFLANMNRGG
jgi:hypothetical protein